MIDELRERLERIEGERTHPFIRIRTDELRELIEEFEQLEQENANLYRAAREAQKA